MSIQSLKLFSPPTEHWFSNTLGEPTPVQMEAWPAIASGSHTLVSAPTGTGKTLSAFLVFIDRLKEQARAGSLKQELQLIYISPLKSLAGDIRENLSRPLYGIYAMEQEQGPELVRNTDLTQALDHKQAHPSSPFEIQVAIRTGDTTAAERRKMIKRPPHILITTPESLYLMLTSVSGQSILRTAKVVIIDELHALIDTKRGAHLMLSLARLDKLCEKPLQRIGLSATIEPLSLAADYLSPDSEKEPTQVVAPKMRKNIRLEVISSFPENGVLPEGSIWPDLARKVYEYCHKARSVLAFGEGRRCIEKLAHYVNELGGEGFARTHHGSLSKEQRLEVEKALRDGRIRLLCATSSMELGIDVGEIDLVLQVGCPMSISGALQRLGRSGHNPGRESVMYLFPRTASEGLYCGITAKIVKAGGIEQTKPPKLCLDVLAQHLVSMATGEGYSVQELMELLLRAYPFRLVTKEELCSVLSMLAGDFEHARDLPVRPRILYDRIHERVEGDAYSRMLALSNSGAIPDRGLYTVRLENGVKLGELDEEFVFERGKGEKFLLGSFAWQIQSVNKDTVYVSQTSTAGATPPFWKGERQGRALETGLAFGRAMRELSEAMSQDGLDGALQRFGLDEQAAKSAKVFLEQQVEATGILPDDQTIVVEHFIDELGDRQMMVHAMFGRKVNAPLSLLAKEAAGRILGVDINAYDDEDGFLLLTYCEKPLPEGLLQDLLPETAQSLLEALLTSTPLFNMAFRYNAFRALMLGMNRGKRQPLWVQRIRSAELLDSILHYKNHPLIRETKRECLEDYWDLKGLETVLKGIRSGAIKIREVFLEEPSPMSLPFRRQVEASFMYDYNTSTSGIRRAGEAELSQMGMDAELIAPAPEQLQKLSERSRNPENPAQLHSLLMMEGDLISGELDVPVDWLNSLVKQGRAAYIEPGLWIAAEHLEEYEAALVQNGAEARAHVLRRLIRYRGAHTPEMLAERYFWTEEEAQSVLTALCEKRSLVLDGELYYHAELYDRARRETVKARRNQIKTLPPERYAALIAGRIRTAAPPSEQLAAALKELCNQAHPLRLWEEVLLPARVNAYRPALLDSLLSQGEFFWQLQNTQLSFHRYEDLDWDADLSERVEQLEACERIVYEALTKRGASFLHGNFGLPVGTDLNGILLSLAEKGLVHADSFAPVRYLLEQDKIQSSTVKHRVKARSKTLTGGRWESARPLQALPVEEALEREFDQAVILCRETIQCLAWGEALETLRTWEFTGRVRRGYFIEGLSGAQFIRDSDFASVQLKLEQPRNELVWLSAADPAQLWGKKLTHLSGSNFTRLPGTVVALKAGVVVALFEQKGQVLRSFDDRYLEEALRVFVSEYNQRRLFSSVKRLALKQYPEAAEEALVKAGFSKQGDSYLFYQNYL